MADCRGFLTPTDFETVFRRVWVRRGGCIGCRWGNWRDRDHWGDLDIDGWIILGWIWWNVGMWTELGWPRIATGGRCL